MMNSRGISFLGMAVMIAIVALLLRIAVAQIIKINIVQNESDALGALKLISTALENYARNNNAAYPLKLSVLTRTEPPYLDKDYIAQSPSNGYNFNCSRLDSSGYNCSAVPAKCNLSGKLIYYISTGGALLAEECEKKE